MLASQIVDTHIPILKPTDSTARALAIMQDYKISHLAVVSKNKLQGLISEEAILTSVKLNQKIADYQLAFSHPSVLSSQHVYEVMGIMSDLGIAIVPVVDAANNYLGLITPAAFLNFFSEITSISNPGGIIVLEVGQRDYSLVEIAKIVESNDAHILSSYISSKPDSVKIEITLKIDKTELSSIILSFERYNYRVVQSFNQHKLFEDSMDRFNSLMNYLNI